MLAYLLDEHLSPKIADLLRIRVPGIRAVSLRHWRAGALMSHSDDTILSAAAQDGLTLVTYDQRTIVPLLVRWGLAGVSHGGVIFVDELTVAPDNIGGIARALVRQYQACGEEDWTDRAEYLRGE